MTQPSVGGTEKEFMMPSANPPIQSAAIRTRAIPAFAALMLGLVLFVGAGFAAPAALHNATHDTRHALGLPCH